MNDYRKIYFDIDNGTSTDQIFALLDTVQSSNDDETGILINDFDTEVIAPEEIELTNNPDNAIVLTPEANVDIADEETKHTKELGTTKNRKKLEGNTLLTWI